ncbi:MAG: hypothetical protein IT165_16240 [Bryobacterales bacterium]|nr:hypothetical protein [Bryobacterales bacterium]
MSRAINLCLVLLSIAGSVVTIVVAYQQWYPAASPDGKLAISFLSTCVLMLAAAAVWQEYRYSRRARYAEILASVTQVFMALSAKNPEQMQNLEEVTNVCRIIVNRLGRIFSLLTGTSCSVCIKVIVVGEGDRPQVATLCRDDTSLHRETGRSPTEAWFSTLEDSDAVQHWISENTDFKEVFRRAGTPQLVYMSNDLPNEPFYANTSFKIYGEPIRTSIRLLRSLMRPLPYRSTIVAPIGARDKIGRYLLSGYLCVDSSSRYVFSRRYDIPLMSAAGEGLHGLLQQYLELADDLIAGEGLE